jgi:hypothetical protein
MPICPDNKFAFIHIPKCGGTTIERHFKIMGKGNFYGDNSQINGMTFSPQHYTYKMLNEKVNLSDYYTFSFVRNPYDRIISEYFWNQNKSFGRIKKSDDYKDFIFWFKNYYKNINADHKLPQYKFICDDEDKILVDTLGRVENFEEDFLNIIFKITNEKPELEFKKPNNKTEKFRKPFLTDEVINAVNQIYQKDFEIFNYPMM